MNKIRKLVSDFFDYFGIFSPVVIVFFFFLVIYMVYINIKVLNKEPRQEITSVTQAMDYFNNNCKVIDSDECPKSRAMIQNYIRSLISIKSMSFIINEATSDDRSGGQLQCINKQPNTSWSAPYCMAIGKLLKEIDPTGRITVEDISDVYNEDKAHIFAVTTKSILERQSESILENAKAKSK